jgi:hypothetical protein
MLKTYIAPETFNKHHSKDGRVFGHEPFNPADTEISDIEEIINEFDNESSFVMKLQFNELTHIVDNGFLEKFKRLSTYNIVLLRKDIFEAALSLLVAITKNEFINFKNLDVIEIDEDRLIHMVDFLLDGYRLLIENVCTLQYNEIKFYEDLTFIPRQDFENTQMYKQDPLSIEDSVLDKCEYRAPAKQSTVRNYKELKTVVTEYLSAKFVAGIPIIETSLDIK